jgi:DNA-binding response OmpR family regulator
MRILVVEDEADLASAVAAGLRREGYAVDVAADGASALDRIATAPYDVVCLDLNLPDLDGLEVCRRVVLKLDAGLGDASDERPRILMLTARGTVEDRIAGLDEGADDYLVKPFSLGELAARVRALTRRATTGTNAVLSWDDLELDAARHEVRHHGEVVELTAKEFALLRWFLLHPQEVHSAERLLEHVWDENADPFTNTVRVTISNLRRKLAVAGDGCQPIETLPGRGYRLRVPA